METKTKATISIAIASFDLLSGVKVVSEWFFPCGKSRPKYTHEDIFKLSLSNVHRQREDIFHGEKNFTTIAEIKELGIYVLTDIFIVPKKPYNTYYGVSIVLNSLVVGGSENITQSIMQQCSSLSKITRVVIEQQTKQQQILSNVYGGYSTMQQSNRFEKNQPKSTGDEEVNSTYGKPSSLPSELNDITKDIHEEKSEFKTDDEDDEPVNLLKLAMDKYVEETRRDCNMYLESHEKRSKTLEPDPADSLFLSHVLSAHLQTQMTTCIVRGPISMTALLADKSNANSPYSMEMDEEEFGEFTKTKNTNEEVRSLFNVLTHFTLDYQLEHSSAKIRDNIVPNLFIQCVDSNCVKEKGLIEFMMMFGTATTIVFLPSRAIIETPASEKQKNWHNEYEKLKTYDDISRTKQLQQLKQQYKRNIRVVTHAAPSASAIISLITQMDPANQAYIAHQQMERLIQNAMCLDTYVNEIIMKGTPQANKASDGKDASEPLSLLRLGKTATSTVSCLTPDNINDIIRELRIPSREDFQLLLSIGQLFDKTIFHKVYGNKF